MKLTEKRRAIEILICASDKGSGLISEVAFDLGHSWSIGCGAERSFRIARSEPYYPLCFTYEECCVETAYRLIASSPTLRKEWFGEK